MATHSSTLVWRIPWTEEPGGLQSMGLQRVRYNWATNTHTHTHTYLKNLSYKWHLKITNINWIKNCIKCSVKLMNHESILRATNFSLEENLILEYEWNSTLFFKNNIAYHLVWRVCFRIYMLNVLYLGNWNPK